MDNKVNGSWLVHHTNKLQNINSQAGYENIFVSGKCGILLSAISSDNQMSVSNERLNALAEAALINTALELPMLLPILKGHGLIDVGATGIEVLGVTNSSVLGHTSSIFESRQPAAREIASIALAEQASTRPIGETSTIAEISALYKVDFATASQIVGDAEQFGFIDSEAISGGEKLLFNGNLFRRDMAQKTSTVLNSLTSAEQVKLIELNEMLKRSACVPSDTAEALLGKHLFEKVNAIGLYDINIVSNATEAVGFITLPSAFSKYSTSIVDDAFDLAKAFVSSISYGIHRSSQSRGKIRMVEQLLGALICGDRVGPNSAISEDYRLLEMKGVVEVSQGSKRSFNGNMRTGPMMRLLKKEVGELALQVIVQGDVSEQSLESLPSAAVTRFRGPEVNRDRVRRAQVKTSPKATNDMLSALRTGHGF